MQFGVVSAVVDSVSLPATSVPAVADAALLVTAIVMVGAGVAVRTGHRRIGRYLAADGWIWFAVLWAVTAPANLTTGRVFLGVVHLLTAGAGVYGATLVIRDVTPGMTLTRAVGGMTVVYAPVELVPAVRRVAIGVTTETTAGVLSLLGFTPTVASTTAASVVTFPAIEAWVQITTACTGVSAMLLFAGLIAVTDAPLVRRCRVIGVVVTTLFLLNATRNAFVVAAMRLGLFGDLLPVAGPVVGTNDPHFLSYFIAETVVTRVAIVVVLVGVTVAVVRSFPELATLVRRTRHQLLTDAAALRRVVR